MELYPYGYNHHGSSTSNHTDINTYLSTYLRTREGGRSSYPQPFLARRPPDLDHVALPVTFPRWLSWVTAG
jgi:hypothetical protein